jgi:hypothetical protein
MPTIQRCLVGCCILGISVVYCQDVKRDSMSNMVYTLEFGSSSGLEWQLEYSASISAGYVLVPGISVLGSVEASKFSEYNPIDNTAVLSQSAKHLVSISSGLRLNPNWVVAPLLSVGLGYSYSSGAEVQLRHISDLPVTLPAASGWASFAFAGLGLQLSPTKQLSFHFEGRLVTGWNRSTGFSNPVQPTYFTTRVGLTIRPS